MVENGCNKRAECKVKRWAVQAVDVRGVVVGVWGGAETKAGTSVGSCSYTVLCSKCKTIRREIGTDARSWKKALKPVQAHTEDAVASAGRG